MKAGKAEGVIDVAAQSIRDLDDQVKERLRMRAASHGRSMEAEIRAIHIEAVSEPAASGGLSADLRPRAQDSSGEISNFRSPLRSPQRSLRRLAPRGLR